MKVKESFFSKYGALIVAAVLFIALGMIYCAPALEGKVVHAGDTINATSAVHEGYTYHEQTGEYTFWTGSMFSGMPNYQIGGGNYTAERLLWPFGKLFNQGGGNPIWMIITYLFSFFILLRVFEVDRWASIAGAIAMALSSYFLVIIVAGHNTKTITIAHMCMVMSGLHLIMRKKYGWGIILTMVFSALGIVAHPQMAYYMFMMMGVLWVAELFIHIKEKRYKDLALGTVLFIASVGIGLGARCSNVFVNKEYVKETMRGGHSDLVQVEPGAQSKSGLSLDYATQYSYGWGETLSFMIPGIKGGSSSANVGTESALYKDMVGKGIDRRAAAQFCQNVPLYWGDQPFTAGNVYMGAIVCFLFVLGLIIVKGPYKWALAVSTLFSALLALGFHFMPLTELFFNYFPMYSKFRAVSSILIVAQVAMPLLGFLAVKQVFDCANSKSVADKHHIVNGIYIAAGITAGICLILALFAGAMFDFKSVGDAAYASQLPDFVYQGILDERKSLLVSDSWRSFMFIALAAALMWVTVNGKLRSIWASMLLAVLVLADMWPVDRRYFNYDNFESPKQNSQIYAMQPYEKQILADPDPNFRVMNLTTSTFNDARTSYYLKSIGGYNAAKLRRYQDLIDTHLSKMSMPVLNMLNTKYFITQGSDGSAEPLLNPNAMGNAWFVQSVQTVASANAEIDALGTVDLHTTAVTDQQFSDYAAASAYAGDAATVKLTSYSPKSLDYEYSAPASGTIVFSEIYYPYGWKASIDGKPADHYRVNYVLRAMNVPAGNHTINFVFDPDSVHTGGTIALICIILMYAVIAFIAVMAVARCKKKQVRA